MGQYRITYWSSNNNRDGLETSMIQGSKKYPTIGYVTNPSMNLTITVTTPLSFDEQFKEFWSVYGQPISIIVGGFAGGFASLVFARFRKTDNDLRILMTRFIRALDMISCASIN